MGHRAVVTAPGAVLGLAFVCACGGGGGGAGASSAAAPEAVLFAGFLFETGTGPPTTVPPTTPPGAPLDTTILFRFVTPDGGPGVPAGPLDARTLPVFTTPADADPDLPLPPATALVPAKGTYTLAGDVVAFRPFVPTVPPISFNPAALPASVPGLLPGSTYTAAVSLGGTKIANLVGLAEGAPAEVRLDTTSNPAAYFAPTSSDGLAPQLVSVSPPSGSVLVPATFSTADPQTGQPHFPAQGAGSVELVYDRAVGTSVANLLGADLDGDGARDPTFAFRSRATRLLVARRLPAGSPFGNAAPVPALGGLLEGSTGGGALVVYGGDEPLAGRRPPDPAWAARPSALAAGRDPSLLFALLPVEDGEDRLLVVDHLLGEPSAAAVDPAGARPIGLTDAAGLLVTLDGRLLTYDRSTRRLVELLAEVSRAPPLGAPVLSPVVPADGADGFRGAPLVEGLEPIALAQAPSGALYTLASSDPTGAATPGTPALVRLARIDPEGDGVFDEQDGAYLETVLVLPGAYADVVFTTETELLALERATDAIDRVDAALGVVGTAASAVAGLDPADGLSFATALAVGAMDVDARAIVVPEDGDATTLRVSPLGILPFGATVTLLERHAFAGLDGVSAVVADDLDPLGWRARGTFTTAAPSAGEGPVDDLFRETFADTARRDETPALVPPAAWAATTAAGTVDAGLRATLGTPDEVALGDFAPPPNPGFDASQQFGPPGAGASGPFVEVLLDTDVQTFPLADGSTPGVSDTTTVFGGRFTFDDVIIPEGVRVRAVGSRPLVVTALGRVEIRGILEVSGGPGLDDDTFNTGFLPTPGGAAGPGAGRGGNGHPTVFDPANGSGLDQYATPETGEHGWGPVVGPDGSVVLQPIGGRGGLSTAGAVFSRTATPCVPGYPCVPNGTPTGPHNERHRPPGGGGGSFHLRGQAAHAGRGEYRVQSFDNGTYAPFPLCPADDKIQFALYGNEENRCQGTTPSAPLQCVYLTDEGFPAGGAPGDWPFADGERSNDYVGPGGEVPVLVGGQGGGGGGSRVDSLNHATWSADHLGGAVGTAPCYPALFGPPVSPTVFDAKGGGGGGGGGAVLLRSFGDIVITRTGHVHARGGRGGGGEQVGNSNFAGAGGGGSGGAVLLQALGEIDLRADPSHARPHFTDRAPPGVAGAQGACIDVSGGEGRDALTQDDGQNTQKPPDGEWSRSDGGHGGFGIVQLQEGGGDGVPRIEQGAFVWAGVRAYAKRGDWINTELDAGGARVAIPPFDCRHEADATNAQAGHPEDDAIVDLLEARAFRYDERAPALVRDPYLVVHGHDPPLIAPEPVPDYEPFGATTCPLDRPEFIGDTPMIDYFGRRVVREPRPERIVAEYAGEGNLQTPEPDPPGTMHLAGDDLPFSVVLDEPGGTLPLEDVDGAPRVPDRFLVDRLPLVPLDVVPLEFTTLSEGTSVWMDFAGVGLRPRDATGLPPPFLAPVRGTYNAATGPVPEGLDGLVVTDAPAAGGVPAHHVAGAGPLDPGLFGPGGPFLPTNDIAVSAPELGLADAVPDNASVRLLFQGAFGVRAGSHVPDPQTLTSWVADPTVLSGHPLIRFRVRFDLGVSDEPGLAFGPGAMRPRVDRVRLRPSY